MRSGRPILSGAKRRQKKAARPGEEKPRTHRGGKDAAALTSAFWYLESPTRVSTKNGRSENDGSARDGIVPALETRVRHTRRCSFRPRCEAGVCAPDKRATNAHRAVGEP